MMTETTTSLILKVDHESGTVSLGHPGADPGYLRGAITHVRIDEIPADTTPAEVVRLYSWTADMTGLYDRREGVDYLAKGRFVFRFSELAPGRMIRE